MIDTFKSNHVYRHRRFIDVDMYVNIVSEGTDAFTLHVIWLNRRYGYTIAPDVVIVHKTDLNHWSLVNETDTETA